MAASTSTAASDSLFEIRRVLDGGMREKTEAIRLFLHKSTDLVQLATWLAIRGAHRSVVR